MTKIELKQSCTALVYSILKYVALDFNEDVQYLYKMYIVFIIIILISFVLTVLFNMHNHVQDFNAIIDDTFYFIGGVQSLYLSISIKSFLNNVFNFF